MPTAPVVSVVPSSTSPNGLTVSPEVLDLTGQPENVTITFNLGAGVSGYRYQTSREDSTCGVDFSSPKPGSRVFTRWTGTPSAAPTTVTCLAQNTDKKSWQYVIVLVNIATGAKVTIDPTIKDN